MRIALVLVVGAIAGCYRGGPPVAPDRPIPQPPSRPARTASDPIGFLPIDSELVAHVDVQQLRHSSVWAQLEPSVMARIGPTLDQFRAACGFDPLPMVKRLAIGMRDLEAAKPTGVLVIRGLDRTQMMTCIERGATAPSKLATIDRGIVTVAADPGESPTVFAFADASTLVLMSGPATTAQVLREILDAGAPLRASAPFIELYARVDARRAGWFVLHGNAKLFDRFAALGAKPHAMLGAVDVATGFAARFHIRFATPDEATNLVGLVQPQLGAVQAIVEKLEVAADDTDVVVDLSLTTEQLAMIAGLVGGP